MSLAGRPAGKKEGGTHGDTPAGRAAACPGPAVLPVGAGREGGRGLPALPCPRLVPVPGWKCRAKFPVNPFVPVPASRGVGGAVGAGQEQRPGLRRGRPGGARRCPPRFPDVLVEATPVASQSIPPLPGENGLFCWHRCLFSSKIASAGSLRWNGSCL